MEENGVPVSLLLDIVRVACSHSGINLAKAFAQVLEEFGIAEKVSVIPEVKISKTYYERPQILSVTCDNASVNDVMIDHLKILLDVFPGSSNWTRCFAHILNLVAKCIMKQFDSPKKKDGDDDNDDDEDAADLVAALDELEDELESGEDDIGNDDNDWEYDMRREMSAEEVEGLEKSVKPVRSVLTKVC